MPFLFARLIRHWSPQMLQLRDCCIEVNGAKFQALGEKLSWWNRLRKVLGNMKMPVDRFAAADRFSKMGDETLKALDLLSMR